QTGCAASALAIACSISALLAKGTFACTSPVLGLNTSPVRPELPATVLPPMKWAISRMDILPRLRARIEQAVLVRFQIAQVAARGKPRESCRRSSLPGPCGCAHNVSGSGCLGDPVVML